MNDDTLAGGATPHTGVRVVGPTGGDLLGAVTAVRGRFRISGDGVDADFAATGPIIERHGLTF